MKTKKTREEPESYDYTLIISTVLFFILMLIFMVGMILIAGQRNSLEAQLSECQDKIPIQEVDFPTCDVKVISCPCLPEDSIFCFRNANICVEFDNCEVIE